MIKKILFFVFLILVLSFAIGFSDEIKNEKEIKEKAIEVKILEIDKNPSEYQDKILKLKGFAKGWAAKDLPQDIKKLFHELKFAKNNTSLSRNWGSFTDKTSVIFYPVVPTKWMEMILYAKIKIVKDKWYIVPLIEIPITSK